MRSRIKELKEIEKRLIKKNQSKRENEVILEKADFKDGKLSASGYKRLKHECEYIDYLEDIEIVVPKECVDGFKDTLETLAANELSHIRKDQRETRMMAFACLFIGIVWFAIGQFFTRTGMMHEITLIATWVFVWTAVTKFFFDRGDLQDRRFSLLQILAAKITVK